MQGACPGTLPSETALLRVTVLEIIIRSGQCKEIGWPRQTINAKSMAVNRESQDFREHNWVVFLNLRSKMALDVRLNFY